MKLIFLRFAASVNTINVQFCLLLLAVVFCAQILVVVLRYLFGIGFVELQDLVIYSFAMLSILGVPIALRWDRHVRVDVFRARWPERINRRVDRLGILLFLAPVFLITLWYALPLVSYSWSVFEGSRETGGLPGFFLVLTALPVSCCLVLVQGLALYLDRTLTVLPDAGNGPGNLAGEDA